MTYPSRRSVWPLLACCLYAAAYSVPVRADEAATASPVATSETASKLQESFVSVAGRLRNSVVTIYCEHINKPAKIDPKTGKPEADPDDDKDDPVQPFGDTDEPRTSLGTGVVVTTDGYVLTNYHVVKGADIVRVLFNADTEAPDRPLAKVIGFDEESDLAVLKVPRQGLDAAQFADSASVRIGEWAMAIGAPFDQPQTVTVGIISALGRHLDKQGKPGLQDYLQTDASINPGNSGGPLINLDGKVVGINTAILSPSRFNVGIGFSVPSNTVRRLLPLLMKGQAVKRGFLGIQYVKIDDAVAKEWGVPGGVQIGALAKKEGAYIGPAKDAGLREDDIITAVNDEVIKTSDRFRSIVAGSAPGTTLKFSIARPDGDKMQRFDASVTLGDWAAQFGDPAKILEVKTTTDAPPAKGIGLNVDDIAKLSAPDKVKYGLGTRDKGVVITKVEPGSVADEGDLRRGLRIMRVRVKDAANAPVGDWLSVSDTAAWNTAVKSLPPGGHLLLQLRDREDVSVYKVIQAPEGANVLQTGLTTG